VLQVVNGSITQKTSTNSSAYQDTGLSATITPSSTSSKILVLVNQVGCRVEVSEARLALRLLADSTVLIEFETNGGFTDFSGVRNFGSCSTSFLHSPNTTSLVTYKTQFKNAVANGTVFVQDKGTQPAPTSTITLMEIAG